MGYNQSWFIPSPGIREVSEYKGSRDTCSFKDPQEHTHGGGTIPQPPDYYGEIRRNRGILNINAKKGHNHVHNYTASLRNKEGHIGTTVAIEYARY
jgi:hypothetical protein